MLLELKSRNRNTLVFFYAILPSFGFCSESEFLVLSRGLATSVANVGTVPFFLTVI
jgi:hypothetical protein